MTLTQVTARRALVLERDGLVAERLQKLLRAEDLSSCIVDDAELFHELASLAHFALFVVGLASTGEAEELARAAECSPLVLVVPLEEDGTAHFRLKFPDAAIVDRHLRDPDCIRRVLAPGSPVRSPAPETVRHTFAPFGLSERQLEVVSRALLGETSREIAGRLFISEMTVRNHLHAIYERVGVSGRRELLGRFVQGLIEGNA